MILVKRVSNMICVRILIESRFSYIFNRSLGLRHECRIDTPVIMR